MNTIIFLSVFLAGIAFFFFLVSYPCLCRGLVGRWCSGLAAEFSISVVKLLRLPGLYSRDFPSCLLVMELALGNLLCATWFQYVTELPLSFSWALD